ncbi:MAG: polyamine aminopropyltransferase [Methylococcaceae bacterium]|nr:polyamine aminopropyltransferase [Methylococcaceae bacterium]
MSKKQLDWTVLSILAIGAGCGLVYEYLLSHYAGRVLGAVEEAIYGIISVMMIFMGVGSFLARKIKNPFAGFAWLELCLALIGASSVLIIGGVFSLAALFPQILAETFSIPPDLIPRGGLVATAESIAQWMPYLVAALLGTLIGMEIPLIGEIRNQIYADHLKNNTGSIYGIDYLGAGFGALLWVFLMLSLEVSLAGALTASVNLLIGLLFFYLFRDKIPSAIYLLMGHAVVALWILQVFSYGSDWAAEMEDMLYRDKVVYHVNTRYQHLVITERITDPTKPTVLTFFINGRTQFASNDEHIYHAMLTYPALAASARHDKVLIIGGGDGLAVRDVLRWNPKQVLLLDLDHDLVELFKTPRMEQGKVVNQRLIAENKGAFNDKRVQTVFGDAFVSINTLIRDEQMFDTVIIDLPDPNHPDLNKLYSARFYHKVFNLLAGDGAMVVQSTSPYHAKNTFISIGKTIKHAGFKHVQQYHQNVPAFGEWGFTIATKNGLSAKQRLQNLTLWPVDDGWTTKGLVLAAFEFGKHFYQLADEIKINRLGSMVAYQYHYSDWQKEMGLYRQ